MWMVTSWLAQPAAAQWPDIGAPLRSGASAPQDAAVIIGNEDYARVPDVPYAVADAEAFRSFRGRDPEVTPLLRHRGLIADTDG